MRERICVHAQSVQKGGLSLALKKIGKTVLYIFGVIIPNITFCMIFIAFMVAILSRYVFRQPVAWTYEISVLGFMWTMFFGVGKAIDMDEHVVFGLVYDVLKPWGKLACKLLYNTILIVLLALMCNPAWKAAMRSTMVTGVLNMPYKIVFFPFFLMTAEIIIRSGLNIIRSVKEYRLTKENA